jgi:hypothetical protein
LAWEDAVQSALTVIVNVKPGQAGALRELLNEIGINIKRNKYIRFAEIPTTHFARWVIIDDDTRLLFTSNYDGDLDSYLEALLEKACPAMQAIYSKCDGYPTGDLSDAQFNAKFKTYMKANSIDYAAFYMGYRGRTVREVKAYIELRKKLEVFFNQKLVEDLFGVLARLPYKEKQPNPILKVITTLLSLPLMFILNMFLPVLLSIISPRPAKDGQLNDPTIQFSAPLSFTERESIVQNELTVISIIDPKRLKRLQIILTLVKYIGRYFTNGSLSNISTIHFARWVIYDNGTKLFFESNYDGTWEQYIGDFVDKANVGMDAIWGNCLDYPERGSKDLQAFKKVIHDHQKRAEVFYSAYPQDSAKNILNDIVIGEKVHKLVGQQGVADWLQRF